MLPLHGCQHHMTILKQNSQFSCFLVQRVMKILLKLCMSVEPKQHVVCHSHCADQMVFECGCKCTTMSVTNQSMTRLQHS